MSLAKSHSSPKKRDRKAKPNLYGDCKIDAYDKAERVLDLVYADITNAVSRSDCLQKLMEGLYENDPLSRRQAVYYYDAALKRFEVDTDIETDKLKKIFYERYESLLAEAIEYGDRMGAKSILDSMSKLFLGMDKPTTAIQVNNEKDGGVVINFGYNKDEN